jgi:hypothetical protein
MLDNGKIDRSAVSKPLIGVAALVVIAACGAWYYWHTRQAPLPVVPTAVPPPAPAPAPAVAEAPIENPVPESAGPKETLPALSDSDVPFKEALTQAVGAPAVSDYLVPASIIRHIVVTVDNLPRQKVALEKRPVVPVAGPFMADGDELHATLDAANFRRYAPLTSVLQTVDAARLAHVYLRYYPLFQKAYEDLGYPSGYFNDRLVQVIDLLLATPQVTGPIDLVRPNVMYEFADPELEARPAGQKILIRMGPENAAVVMAKLKEFRGVIAAAAPQR